MKIRVTQLLIGYDDEPIIDTEPPRSWKKTKDEPYPLMTLRKVCCRSLTAPYNDERGTLHIDEHLKRFLLAGRISRHTTLTLSHDDITFCRLMLAKGYGPNEVGAACQLFDPPDDEEPEGEVDEEPEGEVDEEPEGEVEIEEEPRPKKRSREKPKSGRRQRRER